MYHCHPQRTTTAATAATAATATTAATAAATAAAAPPPAAVGTVSCNYFMIVVTVVTLPLLALPMKLLPL